MEREKAEAYVKEGGQGTVNVRVLATRTERYLPKIKEDVKLLERVLNTYKHKKIKVGEMKGSWRIEKEYSC